MASNNDKGNEPKESGSFIWLVKTASSDTDSKTNTPHWRRRDYFVVADTASDALRNIEGHAGVKAADVRSVTIAGRRCAARVWAEEVGGE